MFSKSCKYGLRAAIFIALESSKGNKTGIREVARQIGSPEAFTAKILQILVKKQIIESYKGPTGGFYIDEATRKKIKLSDIVFATDGESTLGCVLGLKQCSDKNPCPLHEQYVSIRKDLVNLLNSSKLEDLITNVELRQTFLKTEL